MTKKITIEYFGMEGQGETVTKAKQDAGRKIEQAFNGPYAPYLIDLSDEIEGFHPILIWRANQKTDGGRHGSGPAICTTPT